MTEEPQGNAAVAGQLERGVRRHPLDLVCLHSDECRTLMTKGHHDADEFLRACAEWNGFPIKGWGRVRHGWHRTVPDARGEYRTLMTPAKPHARGAYPTTCIVDDATCDVYA
jgi:hypothetical protein